MMVVELKEWRYSKKQVQDIGEKVDKSNLYLGHNYLLL
jgi:hypothetical protein